MKFLLKKLANFIKYILFIIYFIFEEFVIKIAKRALRLIRKINIYDKFIEMIDRSNNFVLLGSFLFLAVLAESSATFAVFLTAKGFVKLGILFYALKIVLFIPAVDIFSHNKKRLVQYRIIRTIYYWYLRIKSSEIYRNIKKFSKEIKAKIKAFFKPIKESVLNFIGNKECTDD